jgi:hypothetical protein
VLRQALFSWAFNPATRQLDPPPETAARLGTTELEPCPRDEGDDDSEPAS